LGNHDQITLAELELILDAKSIEDFQFKIKENLNVLEKFSYNDFFHIFQNKIFKNNKPVEISKELIWLAITIDKNQFYIDSHSFLNEIILNIQAPEQLQSSLFDFIIREQIEDRVQELINQIIFNCKNGTMRLKNYLKLEDSIYLAQKNFKTHLQTKDSITLETISLFYCCHQKLDGNNEFVDDPEVFKSMKNKALEKRDDFIHFLILDNDGLGKIRDLNRFIFSDFLLKIFKNLEELKAFLDPKNFSVESEHAQIFLKYAIPENIVEGMTPMPFNINKDDFDFFKNCYSRNELINWRKPSKNG
jgi:hypothetical protein